MAKDCENPKPMDVSVVEGRVVDGEGSKKKMDSSVDLVDIELDEDWISSLIGKDWCRVRVM